MKTGEDNGTVVSEKDRLCRQGPKLKKTKSINVSGIDPETNLAFGRISHSIRKTKAELVREFVYYFVDKHRDLLEAIDKAEYEYIDKFKEVAEQVNSESIAA